jgi:transposase InsO family protein
MGIRDRPISPRSPWQNGYAERLIGKEEMEKRSRQHVRDQVARMAFGAETRMRSNAREYP